MNVFTYGIVEDPREPANPEGRPFLTNTQRIDWLCYDPKEKRSGPWQRAPHSVADEILLVPEPSYPKGDRNYKYTQVIFKIFPTQQAAVLALQNHLVDFLPTVTDSDAKKNLEHPAISRPHPLSPYNVHYLGFRVQSMKVSFRRAIVTALPLPTLLGSLSPGLIANDILPPKFLPEKPQLPARPGGQLPRRPVHLKLLFNSMHSLDAAVAQGIITMLGQPGVGLRVDPEPRTTYKQLLDDIPALKGNVMFLYNWYMKDPDPVRLLQQLFGAASPNNLTGWTGIGNLTTPGAVEAAVVQIARDVPVLPLYHVERVAAWHRSMGPLSLTDPEGNPKDQFVQ